MLLVVMRQLVKNAVYTIISQEQVAYSVQVIALLAQILKLASLVTQGMAFIIISAQSVPMEPP